MEHATTAAPASITATVSSEPIARWGFHLRTIYQIFCGFVSEQTESLPFHIFVKHPILGRQDCGARSGYCDDTCTVTTEMILQVYSHPRVSDGCLLMFRFCRLRFRDVETPPILDPCVCFTASPPFVLPHPHPLFCMLLFFQTCARTAFIS